LGIAQARGESGNRSSSEVLHTDFTELSYADGHRKAILNGMTITFESGITTLTGTVDQSTLHGILSRIRDLNLTLISVTQIESEEKFASIAGR
jgi:hypothetical protein